MNNVLRISLIAVFASGLTKLKADDNPSTAASFTEDFNGPVLNNHLVVPGGYAFGGAAEPVGSLQNTNGSLPRRFVTTASADFSEVDWKFEITANIVNGGPENGAFVGFGNPLNLNTWEPENSIYMRIFPTGFGGLIDVSIATPLPPYSYIFPLRVPEREGDGVYRIQIRKAGDVVTLGCMTNYTGQPFESSYGVTTSLTSELAFLNRFNSRLFFGVQGPGTTFDDLKIIVGCSPQRAIARAILTNGFVVGTVLLDPGCGYTSAPLVIISGGGGSGAGGRATIENGKIVSVTITNAGSGYTTPPRIEIASPPFVPELSIAVSRVKVTQKVVLGRNYILESSADGVTWIWFGIPFTAENESLVREADVDAAGRFFRIREIP